MRLGVILLLISAVLLLSGCVEKEETKSLEGKKVLMVIAPSDFRDEELLKPKEMFEKAGAEVIVVSSGVSTAKGMLGTVVNVDADIREVNVENFDAVIFVGGYGVEKHKLYDNPIYTSLAKKAYRENKVVGAICLAPTILASADILKNRSATVFPTAKQYIEKKGAIYTDKDVVVSGRVVTAKDTSTAEKFAEEIMRLM